MAASARFFRAAILCGAVWAAAVVGRGAGDRRGSQNQVSAPLVNVQLLAEQKAIQPSHALWVGLQFELPAGWHVYWRNPGDSGEPPTVKWKLPAGFHAGDLQWPAPHRLESPSLVDYGYPDGVVLLVQIRVDTAVKPGSTIPLQADVRYLVCREICVPGRASVAANLSVQSGPPAMNPDAHALFEKTRAEWPKPAPAFWRIRAQSQANTFVLSIATGKSEREGVFFPLDPGEIDNAAPQKVSATPAGIEIRLQKSDSLLKPIARLRGVVELADGRSYTLAAPVAESGTTGSSHASH